jgi:hypothetical protein
MENMDLPKGIKVQNFYSPPGYSPSNSVGFILFSSYEYEAHFS